MCEHSGMTFANPHLSLCSTSQKLWAFEIWKAGLGEARKAWLKVLPPPQNAPPQSIDAGQGAPTQG